MPFSRRRFAKLLQDLNAATSYAEWREIAHVLDEMEGNDEWRREPDSPHYDHELVAEHLARMRRYRKEGNLVALKDLIEESLHRNLGDLSNQALYEYAYSGTKFLIESYLDEVETTFNWLCDTELPGFPDAKKLALVSQAIRVFGQSALILSGGGALGLFHLGVLKALWSQNLMPEVLSGASMGAIVAGGLCARTPTEVDQMWLDPSIVHRRAVRLSSLKDVLVNRCLLSPAQLLEHIVTNLGEYTFRESYERSGMVLNIAVSPTRHRQKPRLLNHITSPDVLIAHAAMASCALPALFPPVKLKRRTRDGLISDYVGDERWIDGSFHGDVPTMRLGRLHNVNHYIVSQANPHVVPFAKIEGKHGMVPAAVDIATAGIRAQARQTLNLGRRRLGKTLWRPTLERAHAMAHQNYTGDINIHPRFRMTDYTRIMKNPSLDEFKAYILAGEQAIWPKIAVIRAQTRVSRVMRACQKRLQTRLDASETGAQDG